MIPFRCDPAEIFRAQLTRRAFLATAVGLTSAATLARFGVPKVRAAVPAPVVAPEAFLQIRGAYGASFSPDGRWLVYLSNESGTDQVWMLDVQTGRTEQRVFGPERVTSARYAPDGQAVIFGSDIGGNERTQFYWLDLERGDVRPLTDRPDAIHDWGGWSPDDRSFAFASNRRDPAFFDVYVQQIPGGQPELVLQHDGLNYPRLWTRDGRALIISRPTSPSTNDLFLLDLASGGLRQLSSHQGLARYESIERTRDGRRLYLVTDQDRDRAALAEMDLRSGGLNILAESEWEVEECELGASGRLLAWTSNQDGLSALHVRDVATGMDLRLPPLPSGVISRMSWQPRARRLAFTSSSFDQPSDIWLLDLESQEARRLTESSRNDVSPSSFVSPELVRFPSFDGLEVPAYLYLPHGQVINEPQPMLIAIHGGPYLQERPDFSPVFQYLNQRGYAVFAPNVRGSAGYGKHYAGLDDGHRRPEAVADLEAGWRWLVDSGLAAPDRIAIMGESYGGFMVMAALASYPDLWAAGVCLRGFANFGSYLESTSPYRRTLREAEYGRLADDAELLRSISPFHRLDRIRAPLMVVHGANDPRVHVSEAEQTVEALRARGAPVEYLRFENEGHGLARLENRLLAYSSIADFLDRAFGPE